MEQNTEASQAVERRAEYDAFCEWVRETPGKPFSDMAWEAWKDGRARLRAALKAQPAPTEAPNFCARCGKRLHAGSIHTCTPPAPTEAQGEDSARLDAYLLPSMSSLCGCKACNQIMTRRMMFICGKCGDKNCPSATNHLNKCMGRARASAETGGVKS